jgi:hypothetical protein
MMPSVVIKSIDIDVMEDTTNGDRRRSFVMGHYTAYGTVYTEAGEFEFSTRLTAEERAMSCDAAVVAVCARIVAAFK